MQLIWCLADFEGDELTKAEDVIGMLLLLTHSPMAAETARLLALRVAELFELREPPLSPVAPTQCAVQDSTSRALNALTACLSKYFLRYRRRGREGGRGRKPPTPPPVLASGVILTAFAAG